MTNQSLAEKMREEITNKLEDAFESVIESKNRYYKENPKKVPGVNEINALITSAAIKNSAISGGASLIPGPWGMLAVVPELIIVIKNQIGLIYDISAAHGQRNVMTKEIAAIIFISALGTSAGSLLTVHGGKYLIKRASLQVFQKMIVLLGGKITQQTLKSAVSKWLPGVGAAAMATWTHYMTRKIGNKALEIFSTGIVCEDGIADIELIEPATTNVRASTTRKSTDFYRIKILTNLAKIDGTVHDDEQKLVLTLLENLDLPPEDKIEIASRLTSDAKDIEGIDFISEHPDEAIALLADMVALAKQDGTIHVLEKLYIRQIGKMLNFSDQDIDELMSAQGNPPSRGQSEPTPD